MEINWLNIERGINKIKSNKRLLAEPRKRTEQTEELETFFFAVPKFATNGVIKIKLLFNFCYNFIFWVKEWCKGGIFFPFVERQIVLRQKTSLWQIYIVSLFLLKWVPPAHSYSHPRISIRSVSYSRPITKNWEKRTCIS